MKFQFQGTAEPRLRGVVELLLEGTENSRSIVELADKGIAACGANSGPARA